MLPQTPENVTSCDPVSFRFDRKPFSPVTSDLPLIDYKRVTNSSQIPNRCEQRSQYRYNKYKQAIDSGSINVWDKTKSLYENLNESSRETINSGQNYTTKPSKISNKFNKTMETFQT